MTKRKYLSLVALLLAVCLSLGACSGDKQPSTENADIIFPEPERQENAQLLGDSAQRSEYEVTLHYASEDSLSLGTLARRLTIDQNEDLIQVLLSELMASAALNGGVDADLLGIEAGGGAVTVNLSIEAGVNRSEQDYLLLCASIANTLLELDGVEAVNVLTGGRSDPLCSLPLGAFTEIQGNIAAAYAQVQSESERVLADDDAQIRRSALLYFPAQGGKYLLPEVRSLSFNPDDAVTAVLAALTAGPLVRSCCLAPVSQGASLLLDAPAVRITEAGERIIELNFSSALSNYLDVAGLEGWQLYASLTLSLCSFVPEVDALRISIDGENITGSIISGRSLLFEDGLMRRSDFTPAIGSTAQMYFARSDGSLERVEVPLAQSEARAPRRMLAALVTSSAPEGLTSVFPEGISAADILGVHVEDRTATVNLSANFYARCQGFSAAQERQLVYAMVNTLTQLNEIGAVGFLVEGAPVESLAQNIYLKTPLLPDPGLVQ